jgi:glutathione peroxidase
MIRRFLAASFVLVSLASAGMAQTPGAKMSPLDFEMKSIDGKAFKFTDLKGKVVLLVNVASKCGNTPQYAGLEKLYEKYEKDGLVVVGVPANNFGGQEPGSNEDIVKFCESTYKVKFPLLEKVSVKGVDIAPLYAFLTSEKTNPKYAGAISWNFEKFLIGKDGSVIGRFSPREQPANLEDPIKKALAK